MFGATQQDRQNVRLRENTAIRVTNTRYGGPEDTMARGWESKAVEEQMAAAAAFSETQRANREGLERKRLKESLQLSRNRVLEDLRRSQNPRYQKILNEALAHLEAKISEIE